MHFVSYVFFRNNMSFERKKMYMCHYYCEIVSAILIFLIKLNHNKIFFQACSSLMVSCLVLLYHKFSYVNLFWFFGIWGTSTLQNIHFFMESVALVTRQAEKRQLPLSPCVKTVFLQINFKNVITIMTWQNLLSYHLKSFALISNILSWTGEKNTCALKISQFCHFSP